MNEEVVKILSENDLRMTRPRKLVFGALKRSKEPLSVANIARIVPEIDRVSVYRTIEVFLNANIIVAVAYGWKQRYELAPPFTSHHHHMICDRCEDVIDIASDQLEEFIRVLAKEQNFNATDHSIEIRGICERCKIK